MDNREIKIELSEANRKLLQSEDRCDKYDYIAAVVCGAIGGMIDIFGVGSPGDSALGTWTDQQVDKAVMAFSRKMGWNPKERNVDNVKSAIGFLERNSRVNYDQRKPGDVNDLFNIAPKTHHMMSLAHSPDVVGLFFSILNQFASKSTFVVNGRLVTIFTDTFELKGGNFIMKIMCGVSNWIIHLMSDIAGSSGAHGRGTGIVMPFYEFFGFCKNGSFNYKNEKQHIAIFFSFDKTDFDGKMVEELALVMPINLSLTLFSVVYPDEDGVVVLELSQKEPVKDIVNRFLSAVQHDMGDKLNGNTVSAGVSSIFYKPERMKECVDEAKKAMRLLRGYNICHSARYFEEIGIYRFFFELGNDVELEDFMMQRLGELISYDKENNSDYIDTLETYLDFGCA